MPKPLPYRAVTASGNQFEFEFPLHPETACDASTCLNLLSAVLCRPAGNLAAGEPRDVH
jgi:hypothetical protein